MFAQTPLVNQPQLMLVAGFILLGWVLMRRQIKVRRKSFNEQREFDKTLRAAASQPNRALPLADAPVETQRWQVAMFDLQRELKADLDTRIAVVQSLLRQVDARIERLETLQQSRTESSSHLNA